MRQAYPGCPALVKIFHSATINSTATSNPKIPLTGVLLLEADWSVCARNSLAGRRVSKKEVIVFSEVEQA